MTPYIPRRRRRRLFAHRRYESTAAPPFMTGFCTTNGIRVGRHGRPGYRIGPNLMADISYCYINFGDAATGS